MTDWVRVASVTECPVGALRAVMADGERVCLANADGTLYAVEDRCSHQDYPLSDGELEGTRLECLYHGAAFDLPTGRAVQLPAIRPVRTFDVEVRGDDIYVRLGG